MYLKRVLVVDDDAHLISVLRLWFAKADIEVLDAPNGVEALHIIHTSAPMALVLTDFMMPEMNGIELVRVLKADNKLFETPVVVMSNNTNPEFRKKAIDLGAAAYLLKPEGARTIAERVKSMILGSGQVIPTGQTGAASAPQIQAMRSSLLALIQLTARSEGLPTEAKSAMISAEKLVESLFAAVPETEA